ncbi:uncharacterized protein FA14DRAFT_179617 [Meira miltonrushii]|uniref:Uncharacterized protein n=1 Tax=Meira miltonrushii TaxID=1280837 RepID=A0A316VFG6_9BASI|nr:uncharacterized protein FA14DRAFT_179617 [Meira miltonrushii]PWN36256.1 hypothetical protein FA14DRAFT_179617 [Meira miltonrushii]
MDITLAVGQNDSPDRNEAINQLTKHYWLSLIDWPTAHVQTQQDVPISEQQRLPKSHAGASSKQEELAQQNQNRRKRKRKYDSERYRKSKSDPVKLSRFIQQRKECNQRKKVEYQEKFEKMTPREQEAEKLKRAERTQHYIRQRRDKKERQTEAAIVDEQVRQELKRKREKKCLAVKEYRKRQDEMFKVGLKNNDPDIKARIQRDKEANRLRGKNHRDRKREQAKKARLSDKD